MNQNSYLNQLFCKFDQEQTEMKLEQQIDDNLKHSYDRLQVEYVIRNDQSIDFSWVRTQQPIPLDVPIFYFEVKIISKLPNSSICIGISDNIILYNKPLGLLIGSIGYHYDGKICYKGKPLQQKIAPYTSEDVVGVGINQVDKKLFFTLKGVRNGPELPYDFQDNQIYPALSLAGVSIVKFNFGAQPFLFDINQLFAFRKAKIQQEVQQQEVSPYGLHLMIQEYLWSEGYIDTLKIFEDESKLQQTELQETQKLKQISSQEMQYEQEFQEEKQNRNSQELNFSPMTPLQRKMSGLQSPNLAQLQFERKTSAFNLDDQQLQNGNYELIQIAEQAFFKNQFVNQDRQQLLIDIKNGEILKAINLLRDNLSEFYQLPQVFAALHTQQFIELIKQGQATEAITYGRQHLINCKDVSIQTIDERLNPHSQKVESVLGLIIYDDPQKSMLRGLLSQQQRERLADFINKQLLVSQNKKFTFNLRMSQPWKFVSNSQYKCVAKSVVEACLQENNSNLIYEQLIQMKPFLKLDNCFIDPPGTQQNKRQIMLNKIAQNMHQIIKSQNKPSSSSPVKRKSAQHHSTGSSPKIRQKDTQRQITEPLSDSQISTKLPNRKYYPKRKLSQEPQLPTLTKFEITFQNPFFAQNPTFCSDRRPIEFQGVVYKRKIKGSL